MEGELIECSHMMAPGMAVWPGKTAITSCTTTTVENNGYGTEIINFTTGTGTHIDSPGHIIQGGRLIHQLTLSELRSPCVLIDVSSKCQANSDYELSVQDILDWEQAHGKMPQNSLVCMRTGWDEKFNSLEEYLNVDKSTGIAHFPGFSKECAEFLIRERSINGIGIDTFSLDPGYTTGNPVHHVILGNDKYQVECMLLKNVPASGATILCLPLKVQDSHEMSARVIAFR